MAPTFTAKLIPKVFHPTLEVYAYLRDNMHHLEALADEIKNHGRNVLGGKFGFQIYVAPNGTQFHKDAKLGYFDR